MSSKWDYPSEIKTKKKKHLDSAQVRAADRQARKEHRKALKAQQHAELLKRK